MLSALLREPLLDSIDINSTDRLLAHKAILERKPMIRDVFTEIHHLMWSLSREHLTGDGLEIEIGAGVLPMKVSYPSVIATDVVRSNEMDRVMDAQAMDLADSSVRTIFAQHCFHHLSDPTKFLSELMRVLVPGGGAVLVEPYWSPVASVIFKRISPTEYFDMAAPSWTSTDTGAMSDANQALSYIVFERDKKLYDSLFPALPVVYQAPLKNYVRYLLSGGLNFRQLIPDALAPAAKIFETLISPLNPLLALHHVLVIRKSNA
ncbi:MAG: methyltransferase [Bradyrhizobium sp.]|nr:methyltransferase [Bradyrhizobium sp.]